MAHTALEYVKTYAASFATLFGTPHPPPPVGTTPSSSQHPSPPVPKEGIILLKPAARTGARLVLLPLLPPPQPKIDLPQEIWRRCLHFAMDLSYEKTHNDGKTYTWLLKCRRDLMLVNKMFRDLVSPMLYAKVRIHTLSGLTALHLAVTSGEQHWDNLRRIPYSTPGRWVLSLDISTLSQDLITRSARLQVDTLLSVIFRLTPLLTEFISDPKLVFSSRTLKAFAEGCGTKIRTIKGLAPHEDSSAMPSSPWLLDCDPTTSLIRACATSLETLEIVGPGKTQDEDIVIDIIAKHHLSFPPLLLPKLHTLTLLGVPNAPVFFTLLNSSETLPSLANVSLSVYSSRRAPSLSAQFLAAHALMIKSLVLSPPPDLPGPHYTTLNPPANEVDADSSSTSIVPFLEEGSEEYYASSILHILPSLENLSVGVPLPPLILAPVRTSKLSRLICPKPVPQLLPFVLEMLPPATAGNGSHAIPSSQMAVGAGGRRRSSSSSSNHSIRRNIPSTPSNPSISTAPARPSSLSFSPLEKPSSPTKIISPSSPTAKTASVTKTTAAGSERMGLRTIVWTKARWLRNDVGSMSRGARYAGEQAEMLKWRRLVAGRGVRLIDADGREAL